MLQFYFCKDLFQVKIALMLFLYFIFLRLILIFRVVYLVFGVGEVILEIVNSILALFLFALLTEDLHADNGFNLIVHDLQVTIYGWCFKIINKNRQLPSIYS